MLVSADAHRKGQRPLRPACRLSSHWGGKAVDLEKRGPEFMAGCGRSCLSDSRGLASVHLSAHGSAQGMALSRGQSCIQ